MNLPRTIPPAGRQTGILLVECLVYIAVFAILIGGGMAAFYFCWDHSKALIYATEDITAARRAGERWRADVRAATGPISVDTTSDEQVVRIPENGRDVVYRLRAGKLTREMTAGHPALLLLPRVRNSRMTPEPRGAVKAWRWELELTERRKEMHLPLKFTFEAVSPNP